MQGIGVLAADMKRWELISIPHVYECERVYMSGRLLSCRLVHPAVHYRVPVPVEEQSTASKP